MSWIMPRRCTASRNELLTALLLLATLALAGCTFNYTPMPPPVPFDVSKRGSVVDEILYLADYRSYHFMLRFEYSDEPGLWRMLGLLGNQPYGRVDNYWASGVVVPLALRITALSPGTNGTILVDEVFKTHGIVIHGFCRDAKPCGYYDRMVHGIALKPGRYRVQAWTVQDTPEFDMVPTSFSVNYHYNSLPIKE